MLAYASFSPRPKGSFCERCQLHQTRRTKTASTRAQLQTSKTMPEASSQMSIKIFLGETLRNFSPCSSPTCEYCEFGLSLIDSPLTSPWRMASQSPVEPSAQEVWAAMEAADALEPPVDNEISRRVTEMMNAARADAGFVPGAAASRAKNRSPLPHSFASPMANQLQTASPQHETRTSTSSAASQTKGKSKSKRRINPKCGRMCPSGSLGFRGETLPDRISRNLFRMN